MLARNHADLMTVPDAFPSHVYDLAFSPDGSMLMACGGDPFSSKSPGLTRLWSFPRGEELGQTPSFHPIHRAISWMPDGRSAFFASNQGQIYRWDLKQNRVTPFRKIDGGQTFIALSPDGTRLLSMAYERDEFQMWDTSTGAEIFSSRTRRGRSIRPSARMGSISRLDTDNDSVCIYHAQTGELWKKILNAGIRPRFHPSGKYLISVRGIANIWNLETGQLKRNLGGVEGSVKSADFSPDGQNVATAGADGTVRLWNIDSGMVVTTFRGHRGRVNSVCFHPSGRFLASGGEQPADVKVWDISRKPEFYTIPASGLGGEPQAIAFDRSGDRMFIAAKSGNLFIKSVASGQVQKHFSIDMLGKWMTPATVAEFSPDATLLAAISGTENSIRLYDTSTGNELRKLQSAPLSKLFQVHWSADGRRLVGISREVPDPKTNNPKQRPTRTIFVWDVDGTEALASYTTDYLVARRLHGSAALNGDGTLLAYDESFVDEGIEKPEVSSQSIRIREPVSGQVVREIPLAAGDTVSMIRFSPDGQTLAVSFRDNSIRLWNLRTGEPLFNQPISGPGTVLSFRPDGSQLAGVDREQVKVWDLQAGVEALDLRGGQPRISDRGFNPQLAWGHDGRRLAISNDLDDVSVWIAQEQHTPEGKAQLFATALARANAWHVRGAEASLRYSNSFALNFHLNQLAGKEIQDELELTVLRDIYIQLGDLAKAQGIWRKLSEMECRIDPEIGSRFCILSLSTRDISAYQTMAKKVREDFGRLPPSGKTFVGLALVLSPENALSVDELNQMTALKDTWPQRVYWNQLIGGLAYYRSGRYQDAATFLEKAAAKHPKIQNEALQDLVLAMTYQRLQRRAEAIQCWERGQKVLAEVRGSFRPNTVRRTPSQWEWWEWAAVQLLEREAAELFR